jgi:quinol monooxygenase YgiN
VIYLIIHLTVKDKADLERVRGLLASAARLSRMEPGCARFEVYQSQADPAQFFLSEHWESAEHLERHRSGQAYTTIYKPQVLPLVDRSGHPSTIIV